MDYNQIRLGNNIRTLRKKKRLSLNELACTVDITPPHLGLIERGKRRIHIEKLCKLSTFFDVSIDDLAYQDFSGKELVVAREKDSDDIHSQIEALLNGASKEELILALNVLREIRKFSEKDKTGMSNEDREIKY